MTNMTKFNEKFPNANSTSNVDPSIKQKTKIGCAILFIVFGVLHLFLGLLSLRYEYLDLALNERITMRPGLPPYEKWRNPTNVQIRVKVFLFAVENPNEFLNGTDKVLRFTEIGPIVYRKRIHQEDVVFHEEDSTLSYTTEYDLEYLEDENEPGLLQRNITIVNPMLLGLAAHIHGHFIAKLAFDLLAAKDHVFIDRSIYDILWNCTSPVLEIVKQIPFAVPRPNTGFLFNSFYPTITRYNVQMGTKHGYENFFKINTLNGESRINMYEDDNREYCPFSLKGAREGTGMPPKLTKDAVIETYQYNLCRTYPLVYNRTVMFKDTVEAYEFVFSNEIYKRHKNPELDCLKQTATVLLPDGLIDSSRCVFGMPVSLSNPHFWGFRGDWENYLGGLNPNTKDHASYFIIEPTTGVQLEAVARIQSNIPMPALENYPKDIKKFSKMILPTFWLEMHMINNDATALFLIEVVNSLPVIQPIMIVILFILSGFCIFKGIVLIAIFEPKLFSQSEKRAKLSSYSNRVEIGEKSIINS